MNAIDRLKKVLVEQVKRGVSPKGLALTISFAITLGTFPIFGLTTLLCFLATLFFKINLPLIQALNYILTPIHIVAIPLYVRLGEWILRAPPVTLNPARMISDFEKHGFSNIFKYGDSIIHAIFAWAIVSPLIGCLTYSIVLFIFKRNRLNKVEQLK